MVWTGICHDGRTQLKIVQGTLNDVIYRDDILDALALPFLQQRSFDHVIQHSNALVKYIEHQTLVIVSFVD
jgi:hypothetical protein